MTRCASDSSGGGVGGRVADLIAAARLDGETSVEVFRTLLDTLARPGTVLAGPELATHGVPPALVPALALADVGLRVAVVGDESELWGEVLRAVTGAVPSGVPVAAIVVALGGLHAAEVQVIERGDALHPELACRLILACRSLRAGPGDEAPPAGTTTLRLCGPGIPEQRVLHVVGVEAEVFEAIAVSNLEFPAGVDCHLVDDTGAVAGIPRSTTVEVIAWAAG